MLRTPENGRERIFEFAGGERNQLSQRSELGLLNDSSLQALQVVEAAARVLEQLEQPLVEQVLLEENDKGQNADASHGHSKTNVAQMKRLITHEERPVGHDGKREERQFRQVRRE